MNPQRDLKATLSNTIEAVRHLILLTSVPVLITSGNFLYAQVGPDAGAMQQQLRREGDQGRSTPAPEPLNEKQPFPSQAKAGDQTIDVSTFKVTGITLITQEQAQEELKRFANSKLTFDQIKDAASSVTRLYSVMGRVALATIPPQEVVDGEVWIKVIEGRVGNITIELDKQSPSRLNPRVIEQFINVNNAHDDFISLSGLERSLALLNETPGNQLSVELIPGEQEETSNIQLNAKDTGLVAGRADVSNYGANNTGIGQISSNLSLNNPTGNGDQATLDLIDSQGSIFGQFKYGVPFGANGWRVSAGVSALNYKGLSSFSSTSTEGEAQTYALSSTYALERTAKSNKTVVLNFESKNYNNLANGLQTSNYRVNTVSVGLNGNYFYDQAYVNWSATATIGNLSIGNATQATNDMQGAATQGEFAKVSFNAGLTQPLPLDRTNVSWLIYGQIANKNLNSAEQFFLGGPYGVRAYPISQGGGSQGAIASAEVVHTYENRLQLGVFLDAGLVQQYKNTFFNWQGQTNADNTYSLFAAGPLLKYSFEKIQVQAALAFRVGDNPLYNQSGQQLNVSNEYEAVKAWAKVTMFF